MKYSLLLIYLLFICVKVASAQSESKELTPGYYVVVGAYADTKELYASRFVESLLKDGYDARYGFNASRNLFFVYLNYFTTLTQALKSMEAARKSGKFVDAWVRVVPGDIKGGPANPGAVSKSNENEQGNRRDKNKQLILEGKKELADTAKESYELIINNQAKKEIKESPMELGNTEVFLSLYNAANNRIVDGEVQVIDAERTKFLVKVTGNEYLVLPDPKSKSGHLSLICDVFGYRKIQNELNYPVPLTDTLKEYVDLVGTTLVVNFDLIRYHRGDMATLYNVYFYNDAAVMQPESKYELNSLLQMMKENPKYRIKLHGHTNGNYHGKILTLGPDKNFFSLVGAKESSGSSMGLSEARAKIIKEFLISEGIDQSRIEVKAWGGRRPLYDKHGVNARKNVRVEVEILAD